VRTFKGKFREWREDKAEEPEDIGKEVLESRTHEDVPDCVDGGRLVLEIAVTCPAVPIKEQLEAASMPLSIIISCAMREGLEGGARLLVEGA
jgi:hypothetical protein